MSTAPTSIWSWMKTATAEDAMKRYLDMIELG
jgi:hypothetical protein